MEVTRKRVRFGGITTFVDPRSDLVLDKKAKIYLHYLPETGPEAKNKNSLKYRMVKHGSGYFIKFLGFYNYETATKNFLQKLVGPEGYGSEDQGEVNKVIQRVPYRAREVIADVIEKKEIPEPLQEPFPAEGVVQGTEDWIGKVIGSFNIADFEAQNGAILEGKSGSRHRFDLVVTSKGEEKSRMAFLNNLSEDTINDIMMFNAFADDCGIELKVMAIDRNLEDPEINLVDEYQISVYDKRSDRIVKLRPSTFIPEELDRDIFGVIKKGSVCMISGRAGVGKTLLSTIYLVQGAARGQNGAILLMEGRGTEYIEEASRFSPAFEEFYKKGTIEVIELSERILRYKDDVSEHKRSPSTFVNMVSSEIRRLVEGSRIERLVIDPISPIISSDKELVCGLFSSLVMPKTAVVITNSIRKSELSAYGIEESFVPNIIKLEKPDPPSNAIRSLVVKKDGTYIKSPPYYFRLSELAGNNVKPLEVRQ